jgi:cytochrome oxidase assembly protein ShyY1
LTVNWLLNRAFADEESSHWEQVYRVQWAWRLRPEIQPLVQWQSDEHSAYAGPGISGKLRIAGQHVEYHLTWLRRISGDIPKDALRVQLEYEF